VETRQILKTHHVIETTGRIRRDVTSYGYQFSIGGLEVDGSDYETYETLIKHELQKVRVTIMIEAKDG
jgi:hypothetical protein